MFPVSNFPVVPSPDGGPPWCFVHCFLTFGRRKDDGHQGRDGCIGNQQYQESFLDISHDSVGQAGGD